MPKIKETHFKIKLTTFIMLKNYSGFIVTLMMICANFVKTDIETTDHIIFPCSVIHAFWLDIHKWIKQKIFPAFISRDNSTVWSCKQKMKNSVFDNCMYFIIISECECCHTFFVHFQWKKKNKKKRKKVKHILVLLQVSRWR